jgi:hypothetical protein
LQSGRKFLDPTQCETIYDDLTHAFGPLGVGAKLSWLARRRRFVEAPQILVGMSIAGQNWKWGVVRVMSAKRPNSDMLNAHGDF